MPPPDRTADIAFYMLLGILLVIWLLLPLWVLFIQWNTSKIKDELRYLVDLIEKKEQDEKEKKNHPSVAVNPDTDITRLFRLQLSFHSKTSSISKIVTLPEKDPSGLLPIILTLII